MNTLEEFLKVFQHEDFRTFIYGGDLNLIKALLLLMLIDIITGIIKAIINKNLWSRKALFGYTRKILILLSITVVNIMDLTMDMSGTLVFTTVIAYIGYEALSIFENMGEMGVPINPKLLEVIKLMENKDKTDGKIEEIIYSEDDKHGKD